MMKEMYVQPAVTKHELLRDITAKKSGYCGPKFSNYGGFGRGFGRGR